MIYSLPYLVLICIYGIFAIWFEKNNNDIIHRRIVIFCFALSIFFFGFRGFCFYDWNVYYVEYHHYNPIDLFKLPISSWPFEMGFTILMLGCKAIYNDYQFFVLVCSIIDITLLFSFLKKYINNIPLDIIICLCMNGLGILTDLMRNSIAILIVANALEWIDKRKPIPFFLSCIVAFTFHISAVIYFPLYFFLHRKLNKWMYLSIFLAGNIVYLFHIPVFLSIVELVAKFISSDLQYKIGEYMSLMPDAGFRLSIGYLERLLTGGLVFCFMNKLRSIRKGNDIFINSILIYYSLFFFFSEFQVISQRLSYLFSFGYWIVWIDLIQCFSIQNNKRLYVTFIGIYCIFKMYGLTNYPIAKYDNVLLGAEPFHIRSNTYNKTYNSVK